MPTGGGGDAAPANSGADASVRLAGRTARTRLAAHMAYCRLKNSDYTIFPCFALFICMANAVKKYYHTHWYQKGRGNSGFQSGLKFPWTGRRFPHVGQINPLSKLDNSGGDTVLQTRILRRTPKLSNSCGIRTLDLRILYLRRYHWATETYIFSNIHSCTDMHGVRIQTSLKNQQRSGQQTQKTII